MLNSDRSMIRLNRRFRKRVLLWHRLDQMTNEELATRGIQRMVGRLGGYKWGNRYLHQRLKSPGKSELTDGEAHPDPGAKDDPDGLVAGAWKNELAHAVVGSTTMKEEIRQKPVSTNSFGVFSFAALLGFSRTRARYILDWHVPNYLPAINTFVLDRNNANRFINRYGGLYRIYRLDRNLELARLLGGTDVISRWTASIRYPLPYVPLHKDQLARESDHERIRCKINLPLYPKQDGDGKIHVTKYDGFVSPCTDGHTYWQWLLEERPQLIDTSAHTQFEIRPDLMFIYSHVLPPNAKDNLHPGMGAAYTQNQADVRVPTIAKIVLVRDMTYTVQRLANGKIEPRRDPGAPMDDEARKAASIHGEGYFGLYNERTKQEEDERDFMRETPGFIVDGERCISVKKGWHDLDATDKYALKLFGGNQMVEFDGLLDEEAWEAKKRAKGLATTTVATIPAANVRVALKVPVSKERRGLVKRGSSKGKRQSKRLKPTRKPVRA